MVVSPPKPLVCVRTVEIPKENEQAFFDWIESNRQLRQRYGILMERILQPTDGKGDWLIITMWESEEKFEKWLVAKEKPAVDTSVGHALVKFGKIKRYDTEAGY
ncbi:MAG: antibiotic biosynthesis monooxygenase family protein [Nostoc sp. ZfuVER08]|jgi:heme-degrading monooxygenase HmoA|nr:antibiotic biosynthesis monooxygenase [Nostoc sp. ZfuVER08]